MTRASRGRGRPGIRGDSMGVKITMVSLGANRGTDDSDNMWGGQSALRQGLTQMRAVGLEPTT